jgi:BirA family transcriptional regulator, biotin operon repressor / biotin---[acetyl-CoA-carboxylase] ligase
VNPYGQGSLVTWTYIELEDVDSTQTAAKVMASQGAPEGTTVVAKTQSSGVGRLGRKWVSPVGGLYMSFILRPGRITRPELASLVAAVATVEGLRKTTGLQPSIRWPNDVMIGGKKLGGVIAEAHASKLGVDEIVIGIGVNCNAPLPKIGELAEATSAAQEWGRPIEIAELKQATLNSFSALYDRWKAGEDMQEVWKKHVATPGKLVSIKLKTDETPFSAKATRIREDGALVVSKGGTIVAVRPEDMERLTELL